MVIPISKCNSGFRFWQIAADCSLSLAWAEAGSAVARARAGVLVLARPASEDAGMTPELSILLDITQRQMLQLLHPIKYLFSTVPLWWFVLNI